MIGLKFFLLKGENLATNRLTKSLFANYDSGLRPVKSNRVTTNVTISFRVQQLLEVVSLRNEFQFEKLILNKIELFWGGIGGRGRWREKGQRKG